MTTIFLDYTETHIIPRKVIQDNLILWIVRRGFWTPRSVDLGSPDSNRQRDSGFLERDSRILVPYAKISRIPESGFSYVWRHTSV